MTNKNKTRKRISVFRSNKYISAQLIDDNLGITLVSVNHFDTKSEKTKKNQAKLAGNILAKKVKDLKIINVYLDRRSRPYHGRIQIFCDALRDGGLNVWIQKKIRKSTIYSTSWT